MLEGASILVVGAGNLQRADDGGWVTKAHIASYLHELSDRFGGCVWVAEVKEIWDGDVPNTASATTGRLDPRKVRAVPMTPGGMSRAPQNCLLLLRELSGCRFAIFFLPAVLSMVPVLPLARFWTTRMAVYLAGDFEAPLEGEVDGKRTPRGMLYRAAFRTAMRVAHVVIARGLFLADAARKFNRNVFETIPLAHMQTGASPNSVELVSDEPRRILYMGLIVESKGVGDLLHALHALAERRPLPEIRLDILGHGPDRPRFEDQTRELGLTGRVKFHGWVQDPERIDRFITESHVVVMPSSTHPEGVPRVIDEALIRRIPVVATRIAGVPDEFRDGEVLLVDPGAPSQLADAIEEILFAPDIRRRYIEGADRRRQDWHGFTSAADQHARILEGEIISG
jgi:glycosyltransferase involved in cell wall biosynthesis